jgi:hypothetical protein
MSPRRDGISTTYKTRVATEKPCKERLGIVIGQLKDRRVFEMAGPVSRIRWAALQTDKLFEISHRDVSMMSTSSVMAGLASHGVTTLVPCVIPF